MYFATSRNRRTPEQTIDILDNYMITHETQTRLAFVACLCLRCNVFVVYIINIFGDDCCPNTVRECT